MKEFKTSLLREKFTIVDLGAKGKSAKPIVALSNRIEIMLKADKKKIQENFVVRAHNMHSCVRMCAKILQSFARSGPFTDREHPYEWDKAWGSILNDYELAYNPGSWIAVYNKGRVVYECGERHPLLDVIEKFDANNPAEYEMAIPMAESAFKKTGKNVHIDYDGNVALAVHLEENNGRCGIILRGADRTTTFSFTAAAKEGKEFQHGQCLAAAAAFLEGIQMAFMVGMNEEKMKLGVLTRKSAEAKQTEMAKVRLNRLSGEIANLEMACNVRYRPERPEFFRIIAEAEKVANELFSQDS